MAYPGVFYSDDGQILRAMQKARENGAMIMMHAENGIAIDVLVQQALARGETDPIYHGLTRPAGAGGRGDQPGDRAGAGRQDCPLYIVHLSAQRRRSRPSRQARDTGPQRVRRDLPAVPLPDAGGPARRARLRGRQVGLLDAAAQQARDAPARTCGRACAATISPIVSTDHCPFCFKDQKELGLGDFSKIPNGIGGVEHRVDLLYQGVVDGKLSLERWVETIATTPARMFGLYPRKGIVAPGSDADIVRLRPERADPDQRRDPPHEHGPLGVRGLPRSPGRVDTVISRGEVIVADGEYHGRQGHGRYVPRGLSSLPAC